MDLKPFEYQKTEYVKVLKILEYVSVTSSTLPDYFLLDSGMPNMPFAVAVPGDVSKPWDLVGNYFVMYDDGEHDIIDEVRFELICTKRT